jgi:hypothetical protein
VRPIAEAIERGDGSADEKIRYPDALSGTRVLAAQEFEGDVRQNQSHGQGGDRRPDVKGLRDVGSIRATIGTAALIGYENAGVARQN